MEVSSQVTKEKYRFSSEWRSIERRRDRHDRQRMYFCKIAGGEIPSSTVYEDEDFRVILDLGPASKDMR